MAPFEMKGFVMRIRCVTQPAMQSGRETARVHRACWVRWCAVPMLLSLETARADEPPIIYASMTCDPSHAQFYMETMLTSDYDQVAQKVIFQQMPTLSPHRSTTGQTTLGELSTSSSTPYRCRIGAHVVTVSSSSRPGSERGECAVWAKGDFQVSVDGKLAVSIPAPRCVDTKINKVRLVFTPARQDEKPPAAYTIDNVVEDAER